MSPSTEHPQALPDIPALRRLTKSMAMLDAILTSDPCYRHYRYDARWGWEKELASMDNGSGDNWFLLFEHGGAVLKGTAHEMLPTSLADDGLFTRRIQKAIPACFSNLVREPALDPEHATFCLWREKADVGWKVVALVGNVISADQDGSAEMLAILDGEPQTYQQFAEEYHEREVPLEAIIAIYEHLPLESILVAETNPETSLKAVRADARRIGYPDTEKRWYSL